MPTKRLRRRDGVEPVQSFGRCATGDSIVCRPRSVDEAQAVFDRARREQRRVVIRGGGHSFDGQAVHDGDTGNHLVLNTDCLQPELIQLDAAAGTARLGAGVRWNNFVQVSLDYARRNDGPLLLPGSMQTGGAATVGGTLAGDCLSRFSGAGGKESLWVESFRLLTTSGELLEVSRNATPDLFSAVVGGHGYIGLVTDATYRLVSIERDSCAHTDITTHTTFRSLIEQQLNLVKRAARHRQPAAISSAWYTKVPGLPSPIKGGVFSSSYRARAVPPLGGFPLYSDLTSSTRYFLEIMARFELANFAIHEFLFHLAKETKEGFDDQVKDFLFFMDGNTNAKLEFERRHHRPFPIVQQTYVVPVDATEAFVKKCMATLFAKGARPTECDMLYVKKDACLMSANYERDGFAVTFAFEPLGDSRCPPKNIAAALYTVSKECLRQGGRIHLVKNLYVDPADFRKMFSDQKDQIGRFEAIKHEYDKGLLLQNRFSDRFFRFAPLAGRRRKGR